MRFLRRLLPFLAVLGLAVHTLAADSWTKWGGDFRQFPSDLGVTDSTPVDTGVYEDNWMVARNSSHFGWDAASGSNDSPICRDRTASDGARLAGTCLSPIDNGHYSTFKLALPHTGSFRIHAASADNGTGRQDFSFVLLDGTTPFDSCTKHTNIGGYAVAPQEVVTCMDTSAHGGSDGGYHTFLTLQNWKDSALSGLYTRAWVTHTFTTDTLRVRVGALSAAGGNQRSAIAYLRVESNGTAPSITVQPSNATVNAPATNNFTVTATGDAPLSYQWKKNGTNVSDGSGGTTASYTTAATSGSDDQAVYTVVVSNASGSVTSSNATLTVNYAPVFTTHPANTTVLAPADAVFTEVVTGRPTPTVQWRRGGTNIGGATSSSYTLSPTALSDNGATFDVVATNSQGSATSNTATLTVNQIPIVTVDPTDRTVAAPASSGAFTVTATGTATLTYQWQKNGSNIGGATSSSYTQSSTASSDNGATFRCIVTNSYGADTTAAATLTVLYAPTISVQPANATKTAPATATFSVTAAGNPSPSYQWKVNGSNVTGGSGGTTSSHTTGATAIANNGDQYTVVVTNNQGTVTSSVATLTINDRPRVTSNPSNVTTYPGHTAQFCGGFTGNPTPTYQWQLEGSDISSATSLCYTTGTLALPDSGGHYRVIAHNAGGDDTTSAALLSVVPEPPPRAHRGGGPLRRMGIGAR